MARQGLQPLYRWFTPSGGRRAIPPTSQGVAKGVSYMAVGASYLVNEVRFGVISDNPITSSPAVLVPLAAIEALTDGEIGSAVRALIPKVQLAQAHAIADHINANGSAECFIPFLSEDKYAHYLAVLEQ